RASRIAASRRGNRIGAPNHGGTQFLAKCPPRTNALHSVNPELPRPGGRSISAAEKIAGRPSPVITRTREARTGIAGYLFPCQQAIKPDTRFVQLAKFFLRRVQNAGCGRQ